MVTPISSVGHVGVRKTSETQGRFSFSKLGLTSITSATRAICSTAAMHTHYSGIVLRLKVATESQRKDPNFMLPFVLQYPDLITYAAKELRESPLFMGPILDKHPQAIEHALPHIQQGPLMRQAIEADPSLIRFAGKEITDDDTFMKTLIQKHIEKYPQLIASASQTVRGDSAFIQPLATTNPFIVEYVSDSLREDETFMREIISSNPQLIRYASEKLLASSSFMKCALGIDSALIQFATKELKANPEFMTFAIELDASLIREIDPELKKTGQLHCFSRDVELMEYALSLDLADPRHMTLIKDAAESIRGSRRLMEKAIEKNPAFYEFATDILKKNVGFSMSVLRKHPSLIGKMSAHFKANAMVMKNVITQDPTCYTHASDSLKEDKEFVKSILRIHPFLVKEIDPAFKADPELMKEVLEKDLSLIDSISSLLSNSAAFLKPFLDKYPELFRFAFLILKKIIEREPRNISAITSISSVDPESIRLAKEQLTPDSLTFKQFDLLLEYVQLVKGKLRKNPELIRDLPKALLEDEFFILSIIDENPQMIAHLPPFLFTHAKIMTAIAWFYPQELLETLRNQAPTQEGFHPLDTLVESGDFVAAMAQNDGFLEKLPAEILAKHKQNAEFVATLSQKSPDFLKTIDPTLLKQHKANPHFVAAMCKQNPDYLKTIDKGFFDKRDFMTVLIAKMPRALNYIGPRLKQDLATPPRDQWIQPVIESIMELEPSPTQRNAYLVQLGLADYHVLKFFPSAFRENTELMTPIAKRHKQALKYLEPEGKLINNPEFFAEIFKTHGLYAYKYASSEVAQVLSYAQKAQLAFLGKVDRRIMPPAPLTDSASNHSSDDDFLADLHIDEV